MLIANEVVEYRASGKEGLVFKIDFEKANNHVSWFFLKQVLEKKGFGSKWVYWMMSCLRLENLEGGTRGLRHGDPLSPFFVYFRSEWIE